MAVVSFGFEAVNITKGNALFMEINGKLSCVAQCFRGCYALAIITRLQVGQLRIRGSIPGRE
jgi:hypothetical protein